MTTKTVQRETPVSVIWTMITDGDCLPVLPIPSDGLEPPRLRVDRPFRSGRLYSTQANKSCIPPEGGKDAVQYFLPEQASGKEYQRKHKRQLKANEREFVDVLINMQQPLR